MSEQEQSGKNQDGTTLVEVENTGEHKRPYRPNELEDPVPETHNKSAPAPAVPILPATIKPDESRTEEKKENEPFTSEISKSNVLKKMGSKKWEAKPESVVTEIEMKSLVQQQPQPIPPDLESALPGPMKDDRDQIHEDDTQEDQTDVRTAELEPKYSGWSEEAGGLPRSDSRASRMSRAVRNLFCCGVKYEAPSEDNISYHRGYAI